MRVSKMWIVALGVALVSGRAALGQPEPTASTAFTYQGQLTQSGQPASGLFDMRFRLFDSLAAGAQQGVTQCLDNVSVSAGRFTAVVDVGAQFGSILSRYLEIEVRADTGAACGAGTGFTVLSPRQLITPSPRASAATTANGLAIPNGSSVVVNLDNAGRVGIGTTGPQSQLHLNGVQDAMRVTAATPTVTLFDTSSASIRTQLQNAGGRFFITSESFLNGTNTGGFTMFNPQGQVGIGTFNPQATLDVAGTIKMAPAIRWKSVHGSAFQPEYFNDAVFGTQGGMQTGGTFGSSTAGTVGFADSNGNYGLYFAPLELPDGCTVVDVCLDGRDTHATRDLSLSIGRIALATGLVTEVATTFTNGAGNFTQHACNGNVAEVIDNQNNVYFLRARMSTSGAQTHWLLAARVKYTVTSPLP